MEHSKIILLLSLFIVSCQSTRTEKSVQENNLPQVSFIISDTLFSSYDSLSAIIFDKTCAKMSNERGGWDDRKYQNPFSPTAPHWKAYLPFSDTFKLQVLDIKGEKVGDSTELFLDQGFYSIKFEKFRNTKSGIYFLSATFCDSLFKRKFMILK